LDVIALLTIFANGFRHMIMRRFIFICALTAASLTVAADEGGERCAPLFDYDAMACIPAPGEYAARVFGTREHIECEQTKSAVVKDTPIYTAPAMKYIDRPECSGWQTLGYMLMGIARCIIYPTVPEGYNPDN